MHVQGSRREGVHSQSVCYMKYQLLGLKFSSYVSFALGQRVLFYFL